MLIFMLLGDMLLWHLLLWVLLSNTGVFYMCLVHWLYWCLSNINIMTFFLCVLPNLSKYIFPSAISLIHNLLMQKKKLVNAVGERHWYINLLRLFGDNRLLGSVVLIEIFLFVFDIVNLSISGGKVFCSEVVIVCKWCK